MSRHPSLGAQLAAIKDLRLAEVGRENFSDIHTWYVKANDGKTDHCDTSEFDEKIVERIEQIFQEHFD